MRLRYSKEQKLRRVACVLSTVLAINSIVTSQVDAAPTGGRVVGGAGSITQSGSNTTINQATQNMAIDWQSYNVNVDERVQYIQPNRSSISLNRILSNQGSTIAGRIDANGQVILVNPNGIFFTPTSVINVGGIIASGLDMSPTDFMNGNYIFNEVLGTDGAVINSGTINASLGGNVALLGKQVENDGLIVANLGTVTLAAGKQAVLTFDQGGLLGVRVSEEILQEEIGIDPAVANDGEIQAEGGRVLLTGSTSQDVFSQAVNTSGIEQATSVVVHEDGSFTLGGGADVVNTGSIDASTASSDQNVGRIVLIGENVTSSGELHADAADGNGGEIELHAQDTTLLTENSLTTARSEANGTGGIVKVLGDRVGLFDEATVDVSGDSGGGQALIGGDYQGKNTQIRNASLTYIASGVSQFADALTTGNGGRLINWSDDYTRFYGNAYARGGNLSGNGGLVEISGKGLDFAGIVNTRAPQGQVGTVLFDPTDINIINGSSGAEDGALPFATGGTGTFEISEQALEGITGSNIELFATNDITIADLTDDGVLGLGITNTNTITFWANSDSTGGGSFTMRGTDTISTQGGGVIIRGVDVAAGNLVTSADNRTGGSVTITATGDVNITGINTRGGDVSFGNDGHEGGVVDIEGNNITLGSVDTSGSDTVGDVCSDNPDVCSNLDNRAGNAGSITLNAFNDIEINGAITGNGGNGPTGHNNDGSGGDAALIDVDASRNIFVNASISANGGDGPSGSGSANGHGGNALGVDINAGNNLVIDAAISANGGTGPNNGNGSADGDGGDAANITLTGGNLVEINNNISSGRGERTGSGDGTDGAHRNIIINGDATDNIIRIASGVSFIGASATVNGLGANDRLETTGTVNNEWIVDGYATGTLENNASASDLLVRFNQMESLGGNDGGDSFIFYTDGNMDGLIDGAGGSNNTLTFNGSTNRIVQLGDRLISEAVDDSNLNVNNVHTITAQDAASNELIADNAPNIWLISNAVDDGINDGTIGTVTFINFENLTGNAGTDTFTIADTGTVTGLIDGGEDGALDGTDTPDTLTLEGSNLTIELGDRTTSNINVINLESIASSGTGNTLQADNTNNTWTIGTSTTVDPTADYGDATTETTVGFSGFTSLRGGSATDGTAADTFNISADFAGTISGGLDTGDAQIDDTSADDFNFQMGLTSFTGTVNGGQGNDSFDIEVASINFSGSSLNGDAGADSFTMNTGMQDVSIDGGDDTDSLIAADETSYWLLTADNTGAVYADTTNRTNQTNARVTFSAVENLTGGDQADDFLINAHGLTFDGTVNGGGNNDVLNVANEANYWRIDADNGGSIHSSAGQRDTDTASRLNFASIETLNGNVNIDNFRVFNGGVVDGEIDGGTITVDDLNTYNTLIGRDASSEWNVSGADSGALHLNDGGTAFDSHYVATFTNINHIAGGNSADRFVMGVTGLISGEIDGGTITVGDTTTYNTLEARTGVDNAWVFTSATSGSLTQTNPAVVPATYVPLFNNIQNYVGGGGAEWANFSANPTAIIDVNVASYTGFTGIIGNGANSTLTGVVGIDNDWEISDLSSITPAVTPPAGTLDGTNDGIVNQGQATELVFIDFANLTGGDQADTFSIETTGNLTGVLNGGGGSSNDLTILNTTIATVELVDSDTTRTTANLNVAGLNSITGNSITTLLSDSGAGNTWVISDNTAGTQTNQGTLNGTSFSNFDSLQGNTNDDRFELHDADDFAGTIAGGDGTGTDELVGGDRALNNWAITATGNTGTVTGLTGNFSGIETLTGNAGQDIFTLHLTVDFAGSVNGAGGASDELRAANRATNNWAISSANSGTVTGLTGTFSNIDTLTGGTQTDIFTLHDTATYQGSINGGDGSSDEIRGGNRLTTWTVTGVSNTGTVSGLSGNFQAVETLTGNGNRDVFNLHDSIDFSGSVNGGGGTNDEVVAGDRVATNIWSITGANNTGTVTGLSGTFSYVETLTGGSGQDNFALLAGQTFNGSLDGNGGTTNTLTGGATTNTWSIDGINGNTVTGLSGTFSNIQNLNGSAGQYNDTFIFVNGGSIAGLIDGRGQQLFTNGDVVDMSGLQSNITLRIGTGQDIVNIERVIGNNDGIANTTYDSELVAENNNNNWNITGTNSGNIDGSITFVNFNNLTGNSGNDIFIFGSSGVITGLMDGGAPDRTPWIPGSGPPDPWNPWTPWVPGTPADIVDYRNVANVDVEIGVNFSNIELVYGSNASNGTLTAAPGTNYWNINGTNSGIVNGTEFRQFNEVRGNVDSDTFIVSGAGNIATIRGGAGNDIFRVEAGTTVGSIYGDSGNDDFLIVGDVTLQDGGADTDSIILDEAGITFVVGDELAGFEGVVANNGGTIQARNDTATIWDVTGDGSGRVRDSGVTDPMEPGPQDFTFSGFTAITGANGTDEFNVSANGSIEGLISGMGGADELTINLNGRVVPTSQINYDGGGNAGDIITINGPDNVYTESYTPDITLSALPAPNDFDQLGFDTATISFELNYRAVESVTDTVVVDGLTLTSNSSTNNIQLGNNTFGATNSASTNVSYAADSKTSISVDTQNNANMEMLGNLNIPETLSINANQVIDSGFSITAGGLVLDGVTSAGTAMNRLAVDVNDLSIINHSGSVYITDTDGITLAQMSNTTGSVDITAAGLIDSSAELTSSGVLTLAANGGGSIDLFGQTHQLSGPLTLTSANDADLNNGVATNLAGVNAQNMRIESTGNITDSGLINVTGTTNLSSDGNIVLNNANDFGTVSIAGANNATINDINNLTITGTSISGTLTATAGVANVNVGTISVGNISANAIELTSNNGAIFEIGPGASSLSARQVELRATQGIGSGPVEIGDPPYTGAINTNTDFLSAISQTGAGVIRIHNTGRVVVRDLRNSNDIMLINNGGDIILGVGSTNTGGANPNLAVGAIDANFGNSVNNSVYPGSVVLMGERGTESVYTQGSGPGVDIIAENLEVANMLNFGSQTGSYPNPIRLMVHNRFYLFTAGIGVVTYPLNVIPRDIRSTADLITLRGFQGLSGQQLIEIESLGDVDPAIFTEVRNYNHDDVAIMLPADQRYTVDEEEEKKKKKKQNQELEQQEQQGKNKDNLSMLDKAVIELEPAR